MPYTDADAWYFPALPHRASGLTPPQASTQKPALAAAQTSTEASTDTTPDINSETAQIPTQTLGKQL